MAVYVRLLRYLRPYRWQVLAGLACLLVATPLSLLHPWIWKYIVDEVVTHRRPDLLAPALGLMLGAHFTGAVLNALRSNLLEKVGQRFVQDLRNEVYAKVQGQSLSYLHEHRSGDLVARAMGDVDQLQEVVLNGTDSVLHNAGTEHMGDFVELLGSGYTHNCRLTYRVQDEAGGIAQALGLAEHFCTGSRACVLLGDNIFRDSLIPFVEKANSRPDWAWIGLKQVHDPSRYGVAELKGDQVVAIDEKPKDPKSDFAVVGIYIYPPDVFNIIKTPQAQRTW